MNNSTATAAVAVAPETWFLQIVIAAAVAVYRLYRRVHRERLRRNLPTYWSI